MSPIPEKVPQPSSMDSLMDLYTGAAKAHNLVLAEHITALARIASLEKQLVWLQRQMFGTSSEKLHSNHSDEPKQAVQSSENPRSGDLKYSEASGATAVNDLSARDSSAIGKPATRKGRLKAGHGWGKIPDELPRVDVIVPPTDERIFLSSLF